MAGKVFHVAVAVVEKHAEKYIGPVKCFHVFHATRLFLTHVFAY